MAERRGFGRAWSAELQPMCGLTGPASAADGGEWRFRQGRASHCEGLGTV